MKCVLWLVLGAISILTVLLIVSRSQTEGFDILGALAPYKDALYECERECEREDPSKRLLAPGNIGCDAYCQSTFSDLARKGLSSPPITDICEVQCSEGKFAKDPLAKDKCIGMCNCHQDVKKWCRELRCPYSTQSPEECMKQCVATQIVNCNQTSWTFKSHG